MRSVQHITEVIECCINMDIVVLGKNTGLLFCIRIPLALLCTVRTNKYDCDKTQVCHANSLCIGCLKFSFPSTDDDDGNDNYTVAVNVIEIFCYYIEP